MTEFYNRHYITTDAQGRITAVWSNGPHPERNTKEAICINKKGSYQVYLTIGGERTEENPRWLTDDGIPLYRWDGEQVVSRTEAEIAADRVTLPSPPPSAFEQLRADVDYIAALGGIQL